MSRRLIVRPEAEEEMADAFDWYDENGDRQLNVVRFSTDDRIMLSGFVDATPSSRSWAVKERELCPRISQIFTD